MCCDEKLDGIIGNEIYQSHLKVHETSLDDVKESKGSQVDIKKQQMGFYFATSVEGSLESDTSNEDQGS
jgi:hypothetical protein